MTQTNMFSYWEGEPSSLSNFKKVEEFHKVYGVAIDAPWTQDLLDLRCRLITEEYHEVEEALDNIDYCFFDDFVDPIKTKELRAELLKELTDLLYVVYGTAIALGLDIDEAFSRVHQSNMSKLGDDGKPIYREDKKVLKGPNYKPPFLGDLV